MSGDQDHRYIAYGLRIRSTLALPEFLPDEPAGSLPSGPPEADLWIRTGPVDSRSVEFDEDGIGFATVGDGDEVCYALEGVGAFLVRGGREVVVDPRPGVQGEVLRLPIIGPVVGIALHQRGCFLLHASAISMSGGPEPASGNEVEPRSNPRGAVAFLGGQGFGKSTLAALLHARQHDLITDDLTAIQLDQGVARVVPSFPQIKLWPDAVTALGDAPNDLPRLHPKFDKRAKRPVNGFAREAVPLRRLYVLALGDEIAIRPIPPQEVVEKLLQYWYGSRFGKKMFRSLDLGPHFLQSAALAESVKVCELRRPPKLFEDPLHAKRVEEVILRDLGED